MKKTEINTYFSRELATKINAGFNVVIGAKTCQVSCDHMTVLEKEGRIYALAVVENRWDDELCLSKTAETITIAFGPMAGYTIKGKAGTFYSRDIGVTYRVKFYKVGKDWWLQGVAGKIALETRDSRYQTKMAWTDDKWFYNSDCHDGDISITYRLSDAMLQSNGTLSKVRRLVKRIKGLGNIKTADIKRVSVYHDKDGAFLHVLVFDKGYYTVYFSDATAA